MKEEHQNVEAKRARSWNNFRCIYHLTTLNEAAAAAAAFTVALNHLVVTSDTRRNDVIIALKKK
jgi:hypothetical protein